MFDFNTFKKNQNKEYSLFEEIIDSNEKQEQEKLKILLNYIKTNTAYITLVFIDLTYINTKYTYKAGTTVKAKVLEIVNEHSIKEEILYYSATSGKIFIFSKKRISQELKESIDEFSTLALKDWLNKNNKDPNTKHPKLIFIADKSEENQKRFEIGPFTQDVFQLFNSALETEHNLKGLRRITQEYLHKYATGEKEDRPSDKELNKMSEVVSYNIFENPIKRLDKNYIEIKNISDIYTREAKLFLANLQNEIKEDSKYLYSAIKHLLNMIEYNEKDTKDSYYLTQVYDDLIKYFLWIEMQKLQLIAFKIEKAYTYFNRESQINPDTKDNIIKIKKESMKMWFESTIKYFEHMIINTKEYNKMNSIRQLIEKYNDNDIKVCKKLRDSIQDFFDNLSVKGAFNVPLEKVKPGPVALDYFKNYLYANFGSEYKQALDYWISRKDIVKQGYYIFVNDQKRLNVAQYTLNGKFITENINNCYIHIAFLEIDGFNSFNTYFFPNDADSRYNLILDKIFEVANNFLKKSFEYFEYNHQNNNIFQTMIPASMGDEFFFSYLTKRKISYIEKKLLEKFLKTVQKEIVNICADVIFPETKKIDIVTKDKNKVSFRQIISRNNKDEISIQMAKIGVSGVLSINNKFIFSNQFEDEKFEKLIEKIEDEMKKVKNKNKGSLKIIR